MLGQPKASSQKKQKQRWFFNIESIDDAEQAIKICYHIFYSLAALQAVIVSYFYFFSKGTAINFAEPVIILILAWFIHQKKNRLAALILFLYTMIIVASTVGNRLGVHLFEYGIQGNNIVIAAFALYGSYYGLRGAFQYYAFRQEKNPAYGADRKWMYFMWIPLGLAGVFTIGFSLFVSTGSTLKMLKGDELVPSDLGFLLSQGIVEPNERIVLFYSAAVLSIREHGTLITDRRVISYQEDEEELWVASAQINEVEEVVISKHGDFFSDSVLIVTLVDGTSFALLAPAENDGDEHFLGEIKRRTR